VVKFAIKSESEEYLKFANWLIVRCMTHEQKVRYAIFAARQVLYICEVNCPGRIEPRKAIEATERWLKNPSYHTACHQEAFELFDMAREWPLFSTIRHAVVSAACAACVTTCISQDGLMEPASSDYSEDAVIYAYCASGMQHSLLVKIFENGLEILNG